MPDVLGLVTKEISGLLTNEPLWAQVIDESRRKILAKKLIETYLASKDKKESQLGEGEISDLISKVTTAVASEVKKPASIGEGELAAAQKFSFNVNRAFATILTTETHIPTEPLEAPAEENQLYPGKSDLDFTLSREALDKMFRGLIADIFSVNSITTMLNKGLNEERNNFSFEEIKGLLNAYFLHGISNAWSLAVRKTYHLSSQIFSMMKIANALDEAGYEQEADEIDSIVRGLLNDQQS